MHVCLITVFVLKRKASGIIALMMHHMAKSLWLSDHNTHRMSLYAGSLRFFFIGPKRPKRVPAEQ